MSYSSIVHINSDSSTNNKNGLSSMYIVPKNAENALY